MFVYIVSVHKVDERKSIYNVIFTGLLSFPDTQTQSYQRVWETTVCVGTKVSGRLHSPSNCIMQDFKCHSRCSIWESWSPSAAYLYPSLNSRRDCLDNIMVCLSKIGFRWHLPGNALFLIGCLFIWGKWGEICHLEKPFHGKLERWEESMQPGQLRRQQEQVWMCRWVWVCQWVWRCLFPSVCFPIIRYSRPERVFMLPCETLF